MIPSYRNECIIKKLPIFASLALHHEIIRIVWHFTLTVPSKTPIQKAIHFSTKTQKNQLKILSKKGNSHSYTIGSETTSGSLVFEPTKVILSSNIFKLSVVLEGVHCALAFDCMCTLHIIVV